MKRPGFDLRVTFFLIFFTKFVLCEVGVISNLLISTVVDRRYATTHVTSRMKNPANESTELVFKMQLPKMAFVSSLIMEIEGKNYTSLIEEKEKAKQTYQKAKSRGKTSGLVEQGLKNFQVSVNVAAHQKVTFFLKYEELLHRVKGVYNLTLNIKPGHEVEELMMEVSIRDTEPITDLSILKTPGNEFELTTPIDKNIETVKDASLLELTYKSEEEVTLIYQRINTGIGEHSPVSDGMLSLAYDLERKTDGGEIKIEGDFFVHYFSPEGLPVMRRHTIFVIDISGSMSAYNKLENVKKAMEAILMDMRSDDTFEVIAFTDDVRTLGKYKGTRLSIKESLRKVKKLNPEGGTNINQALLDAVYNLHSQDESSAQQIVFLTDGEPTTGVVDQATIRENVLAANRKGISIFSLAFGESADLRFLRKISGDSGGFARMIYEHSEPAQQLTGFYEEISSPLLTDLTITYDDIVDTNTIVKSGMLTYFQGDEVVVAGMKDPGAVWVSPKVSGQGRDGQIQLEVTRNQLQPWDPERENKIERMWAYMTVQDMQDMMDLVSDEKEKEDLKARAIEIALKYNFVTRVTSLVVVRPEDQENVEGDDLEDEDDLEYEGDISFKQRSPPYFSSGKNPTYFSSGKNIKIGWVLSVILVIVLQLLCSSL